MKKIIPFLLMSFTAVLLLIPMSNLMAQSTIYVQNFDASITELPTGWTATAGGWVMDTSNSSLAQYPGASGLSNVVVKNSSPTGTYELVTGSISTLNYTGINVLWAARLTKNFTTPGSKVRGFYMSTNAGYTWDSIPYTENPTGSSSPWLVDNSASPIALPASANNQAAIQFKWIVDIVNNAQGTYRIDDFIVAGTAVSTGISTVEQKNLASVFVSSNSTIQIVATSTEKLEVQVFDMLGETVKKATMESSSLSIPANDLMSGVYLVKLSDSINSSVSKIVLNK